MHIAKDIRPLDEGVAEFLTMLREASALLGPRPTISAMRASGAEMRRPLNASGPKMVEVKNLRIGNAPRMDARLYRPSSSADSPAMVYLHGGGWTLLGLDTHDRLMREYAAASGWTVLALDYPLAPETMFPDTVMACVAAFRAIVAEAFALFLRADRLVLGGDSSGANLAAATAIAIRDEGGPTIAGLLLNYGVFDSDLSRPSYAAFGREPYQLTSAKMAFFWDCYCPPHLRADPLAAPLLADLSDLPPVRLVVAEQDILRDENLAFARKIEAAGGSVILDSYAGATHAFLEAIAIAPIAHKAVLGTASWLRSIQDPGALK